MYEIGRVCLKIAGRDANKICVIVDKVDDATVLIDGQTRRKNCNVKHIEPMMQTVKISKGASHDAVKKALESLKIEVSDKKSKKETERPKKTKVKKEKAPKKAAPKKEAKAENKKSETKEEKPKAPE